MLTMAEAVREAMSIAFDERPEVFLLGEDVGIYGGAFGVSGDMYHRYGAERVLDTPIAELGIVGAAVGAALPPALGSKRGTALTTPVFIALRHFAAVMPAAP